MPPKKNKVDKINFERIFEQGKFINSTNLSLKFLLDKKLTSPQMSFVVSKKFAKKAVTRNRLRRRGYAVLNKQLNESPKNIQGIFLFGKESPKLFGEVKQKNTQKLENEIKTILAKLN